MTLCLRRYPLFRHTRHAVMPTFTFSTLDREPQLPSRSAVSWMMAYGGFNGIAHYKPTIIGYPPFMETPIWWPNVHDDSRYVHWLKLLPGMYNIIHDSMIYWNPRSWMISMIKKHPPCLSIPLSSRRVPPWPQLILHLLVYWMWMTRVVKTMLDGDMILIFTNTTMV